MIPKLKPFPSSEKFEDTKGIIKSHKLKDKQYNSQKETMKNPQF
jgi:hypothetical protein